MEWSIHLKNIRLKVFLRFFLSICFIRHFCLYQTLLMVDLYVIKSMKRWTYIDIRKLMNWIIKWLIYKSMQILQMIKELISHICLNLQPKPPDYFGDISLKKAIFRKYLMESCSLKLDLPLLFKKFANWYFISEMFSKVWQVHTTLF